MLLQAVVERLPPGETIEGMAKRFTTSSTNRLVVRAALLGSRTKSKSARYAVRIKCRGVLVQRTAASIDQDGGLAVLAEAIRKIAKRSAMLPCSVATL